MRGLANRLGVVGAGLGVLAGVVQWAAGSEIPEWTGDKLHPEQLGLITIALSALALVSVRLATRRAGVSPLGRGLVAGVGIIAPAAICFTTVGRLWLVPGSLLLVAGGLILLDLRGDRNPPPGRGARRFR